MYSYLILNTIFVLLVSLLLKLTVPRQRRVLLALLLMTAVFDSLIVYLDIVAYDPHKILGLRVGWAPVEDFAYPILAFLLIPALWRRFRSTHAK